MGRMVDARVYLLIARLGGGGGVSAVPARRLAIGSYDCGVTYFISFTAIPIQISQKSIWY